MRSFFVTMAAVAAMLLPAVGGVGARGDKGAKQDPGDGGKADDPVRRILLAGDRPAKDVFEIRRRLKDHGGQLKAHLVVNGGHDNPARTDRRRVKFMCFATYANEARGKAVEEGELFFGFFLGEDKGTVVLRTGF